MKKIAIFASGSGTNAENIIRKFENDSYIKVGFVLTNNLKAPVINRLKSYNVPLYYISNSDFKDGQKVLSLLSEHEIDLIVLAGFLRMVPPLLLHEFTQRIINLHPSLLPLHGGKGMYGLSVHQSVIDNHESFSGITIHYVNDKYDEGNIILQEKCRVAKDETAESLANKIHSLEYKHYPSVIESLLYPQK